MSVSSLPEWKQLLLERKKREEEERERREKEEEEKLASIPAWKRVIIQRRRAKQEGLGERERERDGDVDGSLPGGEASPGVTGPWLDRDPRPSRCRVSTETITPVCRNLFICSESARRRGRETETAEERGNDHGERDRDREREREWERPTGRKQEDGWERDSDSSGSLSGLSLVSGLRTIRADNVIIIEQEGRGNGERRGRRREREEEGERGMGVEEEREQRGVNMDLRELLAGGRGVTEIRASEVLIIKPSAGPGEREEGEEPGRDRERDGETKATRDGRRDGGERQPPGWEAAWVGADKQRGKERLAAAREDRKCGSAATERGARVSELLSRFGEHHRPPARSKSSENFARPGRDGGPGDKDGGRRGEGKNGTFRGVPKRSFSFSDRVVRAAENGAGEGGVPRRREEAERSHWERRAGPGGGGGDGGHSERTGGQTPRRPWTRLTDGGGRTAAGGEGAESAVRGGGDGGVAPEREVGFTVASVVRTAAEGVSFARRVAIRQDGRARAAEEAEPRVPERAGLDLRRGDGGEGGGCSSTTPGETPWRGGAFPGGAGPAGAECHSLLVAMARRPGEPSRGADFHGGGPAAQERHSLLSQRTEDLINTMRRAGDTTNARGGKRSTEAGRENTPDGRVHGNTRPEEVHQDESPQRVGPPEGASPLTPLEIRIPRTVFYGVEEAPGRTRPRVLSDGGRGGGEGVVRRDSWRVGKPLSRVESLREKIRERERERLRAAGGGDREGGSADGTEGGASDRCEGRRPGGAAERGSKPAAVRVRKGEEEEENDGGQEAPGAHTATALDGRQEADVSQAVPQLPVPPSPSQDSEPEAHSTESDEEEDEEDRLRNEELRCGEKVWQVRPVDSGGEEGEEELSEEEEDDEEEGPSVSPPEPLPLSLAAMSRIYTLKAGGKRASPGDVASGLQTVRRQVELLRVKEREARWPPGDGAPPASAWKVPGPRERESGAQQSPREPLHRPRENHSSKPWQKESQTPQSDQPSSVPVTPGSVPSHENSLKRQDGGYCPPAPSCSPCSSPAASRSPSPSVSLSPSVSPSPSPPPALFSIRSASGGRAGKRGTTITITPRKTAGEAAAGPLEAPSPATAVPGTQAQPPALTTQAAKGVKKRYPTAEEIMVIGGYQNLERSCLIKSKGIPKGVKVCFDETQLERVCEYPSEISMLGSPSDADDKGREEEEAREEEEEEEEEERGVYVPKSTRSVGAVTGRALRVDESCPR